MRNLIITLILGAAIGFGCAKAIDQPVVASASQVINEPFKPGAMFGVAHFVLEEGADKVEFERVLIEEYFPAWQAAWEKAGTGVKGYMIKGERGSREGQLGYLMYYPNLEVRNKYFPSTGPTEAFMDLVDEVDISITQFDGFIEQVHLGDQIIQATK